MVLVSLCYLSNFTFLISYTSTVCIDVEYKVDDKTRIDTFGA